MRLTASTHLVDNLCKPFTDEPMYLKKFGFEGIDFSLNLDLSAAFGERWQERVEKTAGDCISYGIPVVQTHLPYTFAPGTPDEVRAEMMRQAIVATEMLGSKLTVFHAINAAPEEEGRRRSLEFFPPLIEFADKHNVSMLVEIMPNFCAYPITASALCDLADALEIGVCWDFGHPNVNKFHLPNDQSDDLRLIGKRLKALHVNDNAGGRPDEHLPPYMGSIDWNNLIPVLKEIGYEGDFNYEVLIREIPDYMTPTIAEYLVTVGRKLVALCS